MSITERTLRNWRREALNGGKQILTLSGHMEAPAVQELLVEVKQLNERILRLTAELLDQYLIRPRR